MKAPDRRGLGTGERVGLPVPGFAPAKVFLRWLANQRGDSKGLWPKLAKKGAGVARVTRQQAIEAAREVVHPPRTKAV